MQKVKLNIVPKGVKKTTYLSQNDNGRVVRYELFNELIPYILDGSETITVKVVRPDGEEILESIENTFEGKAYIDVSFNDDMSAITGVGAGEIKITDGETELGSHNFDINVEIDAYNGKDVVIETASGTLAEFDTEVEDNALEYESEIPYNAEGYTGLRVINTRTAPVYDKTPYLFRKTPSGSGNSCIEKLTGLSVAFNQLIDNPNFSSSSGWSSSGCSLSVSNNEGILRKLSTETNIFSLFQSKTGLLISGHKCIVTFKAKYNDETMRGIRVREPFVSSDLTLNTTYTAYSKIGIIRENANIIEIQCLLSGLTTSTDYEVSIKDVNFIDLTQMLGSTIADYIYNLETQTAGAGVSLFKSLGFDKSYYEYNAGSLMSVKTSGRKTIGFNQFDEEMELGSYNENGAPVSSNTVLRTKNYIKVFSDTAYYIKSSMNGILFWYDAGENFIGSMPFNSVGDTKTAPSNAKLLHFRLASNYGTTYKHDICINISDPERNGQYEPYNAVTYPLDPDLELRGIPKLDANNKRYGDGDIYESNGDVTRRYGIVDLGSLSWVYTDQGFFNASLTGFKYVTEATALPPLICLPYITDTPAHVYAGTTDKTISSGTGAPNVWIRDSAYSDAATFKTAMSGVYLIYELATPTSESADPYTDPQEARVTEEFIDNRAIPIPVGHDTIYGTDIEYQDIDFDTTIYGGEIDAVNGVLSSEYNSDGSVKPTPEIIDITPTPIPVRAGDNKIFNSANGNQTIRYYNQVEE